MTAILASLALGQVAHTSPDPRKCKKCLPAYEKAMAHVRKELKSSPFPAQTVAAWLLLADGRFADDLDFCAKTAVQWKSRRTSYSREGSIWFPALAGLFLAEYFKYFPTPQARAAIEEIIDEFVKHQERTGGWFKWFEGAYNDISYFVRDLGMLDGIIFGFLWTVRTEGFRVPDAALQRADQCLAAITLASGISYGTGSRLPDQTGARGSFAMLGLEFAGQTQHKIMTTYATWLGKCVPNLDQGHHWGGLHGLGAALGFHLQGPGVYAALAGRWLDQYIGKQAEDGSVYIGDDGDAGGEKGLLRSNLASTASFALMILLQDPKVLRPVRKAPTNKPSGIFGGAKSSAEFFSTSK